MEEDKMSRVDLKFFIFVFTNADETEIDTALLDLLSEVLRLPTDALEIDRRFETSDEVILGLDLRRLGDESVDDIFYFVDNIANVPYQHLDPFILSPLLHRVPQKSSEHAKISIKIFNIAFSVADQMLVIN